MSIHYYEYIDFCKRMRIRRTSQRFVKIPSKICEILRIPEIVTHVVFRFDVDRLVALPISFADYGMLKYSPISPRPYKIVRIGKGVKTEYIIYIPRKYDVFSDEVDVCLAYVCSYVEYVKCFPYIIIQKPKD